MNENIILKSLVNDNIERFSLRRKSEFSLNLNVEPKTLKNKIKIYHYPTLVKIEDEYKPFTITFEDITFRFIKSKKNIIIEIPTKENQYFIVAIRQMATSIRTVYNKEIKGFFYERVKNIYRFTIKVNNTSKFLSITGQVINPFGGSFIGMLNKNVKAKNIRVQFFIYSNETNSYYNTRIISLELDEPVKNENVNDDNLIPYEDFKKLNIDSRLQYYVSNLEVYNQNINNKIYCWMGIYIDDDIEEKVFSCNYLDLQKLEKENKNYLPNTYLLKGCKALKKDCKKYIDIEGFYHYFVVLMFDSKSYDITPTIENKLKLYNVVRNYLSTRLIDTLGLWYDESTPPTSCIHFNIHLRSKLKLNYIYVLFDDWKKYNGKPHISHMFDPLLGRLYLSRNNKMFLNDKKTINYKYKNSENIFDEARLEFLPCFNSKDSSSFIDFLQTEFDKVYVDLEETYHLMLDKKININKSIENSITIQNVEIEEIKEINNNVTDVDNKHISSSIVVVNDDLKSNENTIIKESNLKSNETNNVVKDDDLISLLSQLNNEQRNNLIGVLTLLNNK